MLLLVLRSLLVYGATAGAIIWLARRVVGPVRRRIAIFLAAAPLLLTGHAMLTGGVHAPLDIVYNADPFRSFRASLGFTPDPVPTLGDVVYQEIPWRKAVRAAVKRGELPLWNPHVLAGEPLLAVQQPAVFHPGTWIGFLLPLAQAWTFEMALRIFLALLCGYLFLREIGLREVPALIGAAGWGFSNYLVFFLGYPLSAAAAPFPLLLLGLRRVARAPSAGPDGIVVAALLLMVTSGHPESLLHAVAAAGLFFLAELARLRRGEAGRALLHALGAGALTLGLSAVLLLPLAEALPHTFEHSLRSSAYAQRIRSMPWSGVLARLGLELSPFPAASSALPAWYRGPFLATGYCGSLLLPLAFAGIFGRSRYRWIFAALGALALSVAACTPAADALARLPLFDIAINERLIFITALSVCVLAALGAERILDGDGRAAFLTGSLATLGGVALLYFRYAERAGPVFGSVGAVRESFLLQVVPLLAAAVLVGLPSRPWRARVAVPSLLVLLLFQRGLEAGGFYPTFPARTFYPPLSVLAKIPRGEPFRFVSLDYTFIPNVAALYGLEDVRGYEAMTFHPLFETYPIWCIHQPIWYNRVTDPTSPFLSFLNVRWVLAPRETVTPTGWSVVGEGEGMRLLENPAVLPRAFVPRSLAFEPEPARRLEILGAIRNFADRGVVGEPGASGWIANGDADVSIRGYRADRLDLDVRARNAALVATSIPAWPGWMAEIDGAVAPLVSYNHAFVGVRVPEGRHRLELRYAPRSFRAGAAISLACVVIAAVLMVRRRRAAPAGG